jgi:RNA polymerase sigma-70 factor, ECF subfamily
MAALAAVFGMDVTMPDADHTASAAEEADAALMQRYSRGDGDAFQELYLRYRAPLHRFTLRLSGNPVEAEEIFQEVWMAVVRGKERYVSSARFITYLFAIAHRRSSDRWRKRLRRGDRNDDLPTGGELTGTEAEAADTPLPDELIHNLELGQALLAAIASLPLPQRETFLMRCEGDLNLEEIAAATGVSRETAKSRLRYATQRLRQALQAWR